MFGAVKGGPFACLVRRRGCGGSDGPPRAVGAPRPRRTGLEGHKDPPAAKAAQVQKEAVDAILDARGRWKKPEESEEEEEEEEARGSASLM